MDTEIELFEPPNLNQLGFISGDGRRPKFTKVR